VLVIDSDPGVRKLLHSSFLSSQYKCAEAADLEEGRRLLAQVRPDLIMMEAETPAQLDAIAQMKRVRRVPLIVLSTVKNQMIRALDAGADDYVEKPFHVAELLARVRVALRHAAQVGPGETSLQLGGGVTLDLQRRLVTRDNIPIRLSRREYEVLVYFARHVGQSLTARQILKDIWGARKKNVTVLREYISLLRQKLETDPSHPQYLLTDPAGGYRLWAGNSQPAKTCSSL
jgi:two-component system KDP operon response regulator KdpE